MSKKIENLPKTIVLIDGSNFYHYLKKMGVNITSHSTTPLLVCGLTGVINNCQL